MKTTWRTAWQQGDIVVWREDDEVDRIAGDAIARVFLLYRGRGESPGEIERSIVELDGGECIVFAAATGFAGRVNFERETFWRGRDCVYWVDSSRAVLPWRFRFGWPGETRHGAGRVGASHLAASIARWPIEGPQTWEQRKKSRLERSRPFGFNRDERAAA